MQAQASGADVVGLANGGGDLINSIKTAKEFGIAQTMRLAGLMVFITDIHSLGLETTAGMYLTDGWYWDKNDASREFSKRFYEKNQKRSEEHTSELQSLMRNSYAVFCLKK